MGLLFENGPIYTMTGSGGAPPEALLTRGDRIVHVGPRPGGLPGGVRVIDLAGRPLLPGLCDSHLHLLLAARQRAAVDCRGAPDVETVQARVRDRARATPPGRWIVGLGWEMKDLFRSTSPSVGPLDRAAPDHPVFLLSKDVHSAWVNQEALERVMALDRLPDTCVLRKEQGLVLEAVVELMHTLVPPPTVDEKRALLGQFVDDLNEHGVTAVHAHDPVQDLALFRDNLLDRARGRLRVLWNPVFESPDHLRRGWAGARDRATPGWLEVGGVKLFVDGTMGSLTAAISAPYTGAVDRADDRGMLTMDAEDLDAWLRAVSEVGTHAAFHVIGDRAVSLVLDRIRAAPAAPGPHRLEHAQLLPEDLDLSAFRGLVLSCQPSHMADDHPIARRHLTAALSRRAYAFRTMVDRGALLVFGSDAPVETINPWPGIQAAVTRLESADTKPWNRAEALTVAEALAAHTAGPARLHGKGFATGALEPGRKADLVVLDADPFTVDPTRLHRIQARMTIVDGHPVFEA